MESAITARTLIVGEAFGISLDDEQTFTVYDDFEIRINRGDVVFITGDSGSGKSLLLRELRDRMPDSRASSELEIKPDVPIIEQVGKDIDEALYLLSLVGLNDAFLFLRKYSELSDGQKYRFQLAKLLDSDAETWFVDEFCAFLDRETAKVVSFNMQKVARKFGRTLIVATTHGDLLDDISPSVLVKKGIENDVSVEYRAASSSQCSVVKDMEIVEGTKHEYEVLARFHYRGHRVPAVQRIFTLKKGDEVAGVIVYVYPPLALGGRNAYTDRYKATSSEVAHRLNDEVVMISRVILHPKYRGIGLGAKLIRDTLPLTGKRYVEALTVMGRFNPFNERAGLKKVPYEVRDRAKKVRNMLLELGWSLEWASSRQYNAEKLSQLDADTYETVAKAVIARVMDGKAGGVFGSKRKDNRKTWNVAEWTINEVAEMVKDLVPRKKVYLIWENPNWQ